MTRGSSRAAPGTLPELTADDLDWGNPAIADPAVARQAVHGDAPPIATDYLRQAGVYELTQDSPPDDVKDRLRRLVAASTRVDPLMRTTIREATIAHLKTVGVQSAVKMVDAALTQPETPRPSQATVLVDQAVASGAEWWHTPDGDGYVTLRIGTHREHHRLQSRALRDWLARLYHAHAGRTPSSQAIADALATLGGMARYDGAEHPVSVRLAGNDDAVYLDLADADWRAVEITGTGYRVVDDPPVRFRRGRATRALPAPEPGGALDALCEVIHIDHDDDWHLLVGWLVGALRPRGPYTILALDGEQGAGKSTSARVLRRLIDPSAAELRAEPREIRDLMIAAAGGWVVALDNVSHLSPWLSDALCRIATGGALSTRALYTDDDEHVLEAMRPSLLTGIASVITRGDLQDRAIPITLPAIPDDRRRPEAELWAAYDAIRPRVLGALLDAVACAIGRERTIRVDRLPRMADWARWVTAAEPALGWPPETILAAYRTRSTDAIETALDGDLVAHAIRALPLPWEGTSSVLLETITPKPAPPHWPTSPRQLSAILRRLAPQLRRVGTDVRLPERARTARERVITITRNNGGETGQTGPIGQPDAPSARQTSGLSYVSYSAPTVSRGGR